jgi:hypothetical protein
MMYSQHKTFISIVLLATFIFGAYLLYVSVEPNVLPIEQIPVAGEISVKGMMVCLPHKDSDGPHTMECAFGLQDEEGRYYGLRDTDPMYKNLSKVATNVFVEVKGTFVPQNDTKYKGIGIIEVTSITLADVPQRITLTGTLVCLPPKDSLHPYTGECTRGIRTNEGIHYAVDFSLSSQHPNNFSNEDVITASGVLTPIEQLSSNHWQKYDIKGIFSITDVKKP